MGNDLKLSITNQKNTTYTDENIRGSFLNPGPDKYEELRRSEEFFDKSMLLAYTNSVIESAQKYICFSRPRRFGKTAAADMICAYYDRTVAAQEVFEGLEFSKHSTFEKVNAVHDSKKLLESTINGDEKLVAEYVEKAHMETSHLQYNDENALSYTISLAYYAARDDYEVIREMPTGKGYADLVFIPRKHSVNKPALIVELKWNKKAKTAIDQIKEKNYANSLSRIRDKVILVGINYDKKSRKHTCKIEEFPIN